MPEVCRFNGIVIYINFNDHNPPHFHALYGEYEAVIDINSAAMTEGRLPARARRLVIRWASLRQEELISAWNRAQNLEPLDRIAPLD